MKLFNDSENDLSAFEEDFVDETDNEDDLIKEEETVLLPPIPATVTKKAAVTFSVWTINPSYHQGIKEAWKAHESH